MNRDTQSPFAARRWKVQFVATSLPVGGAETLLQNLLERLDRQVFDPAVVCLKEPGVIGEQLAQHIPVRSNVLLGKWDLRVLPRLVRHFKGTDVVITVGAGDKMFWGRLAARIAGVPVICSALHSTGWPDRVGHLNRLLTRITDGFIACAQPHAEHLIRHERFPANRVYMIPNGVDTDRFRPNHAQRDRLRGELGLPQECPIVGIVAALRPEKNHAQFLQAAHEVIRLNRDVHFIVVGDGPERASILEMLSQLGIASRFHLLGNRSDTEYLLAGMDVFCLTSRNEANPVSILEALSCGIPVVAPDVGSISEAVIPRRTGMLTKPLSATSTADAIIQLLSNRCWANSLGLNGRQLVRSQFSLQNMVSGYENLMAGLIHAHTQGHQLAPTLAAPTAGAVDSLDVHTPPPCTTSETPDVSASHGDGAGVDASAAVPAQAIQFPPSGIGSGSQVH